jgi:hypothetical protein
MSKGGLDRCEGDFQREVSIHVACGNSAIKSVAPVEHRATVETNRKIEFVVSAGLSAFTGAQLHTNEMEHA